MWILISLHNLELFLSLVHKLKDLAVWYPENLNYATTKNL